MNSKKHKLPRRILAMLLAICMFVTMFPSAMFAEPSDVSYSDKATAQQATGVTANKSVSGPDEDGNYTVTLDVTGTTNTLDEIQNVPADIVLVVDTSTSMEEEVDGSRCGGTLEKHEGWLGATYYECTKCGHIWYSGWNLPETCTEKLTRLDVAKAAATNFVEKLMIEKSDVKIGLYDFSGSYRTKVDLTDVDGRQKLIDEIDDLSCPGRGDGTDYGVGLSGAQEILNASTDNSRQKFVVFISDGKPEASGDPEDLYGTETANELKNDGVTIFTVGVDVDDNAAGALRNISSTYRDDSGNMRYRYYSASTDGGSGALNAILEEIRKEITSTIHAGKNAYMRDVINTKSFEYVKGSASEGLTMGDDGKTLTWDIGDITKDKKKVTFKIKLKDSNIAEGDLFTNEDVSLTFDSTKVGQEVTFDKGAIGDPTVGVYKVTYTDGVEDEVIFADQVTYNLVSGDKTPNFEGNLTREGYTFSGWNPQLSNTVSGSARYEAQWTPIAQYTVKYDLNGGEGTTPDSVTGYANTEVTVASGEGFSRPGYIFKGWNDKADGTGIDYARTFVLEKNVTLYAQWIAREDTGYKVEYYFENIEDDDYTLRDTVNKEGTTGTETNETAPTIDGFTAQSIEQKTIAADGSTVVKIYYDRNEYTIYYQITGDYFTDENTEEANGQKYYDIVPNVKFGADIAVITDDMDTEEGYIWSGWSGLISGTMPANDIRVTGSYSPATDTKYTVNHWLQNIDNNVYTLDADQTQTLSGTTGEMTKAQAHSYSGFTAQAFEQEAIEADGSTVIDIYYDRNVYDITYQITGAYFADESYKVVENIKYGSSLTLIGDDMDKDGYLWSGWTGLPQTMPNNDVTVIGSYSAKTDTQYKVEHYQENLDGSYPATPTVTETLSGSTGSEVTAMPKNYEGFTLDKDAEGTVAKGVILGDGTLVLKLFYERNTYQVSYALNGGTGADGVDYDSQTFKYGEQVTVKAAPTMAYREFQGWQYNDDGGKVNPGHQFSMPARDITFTATWDAENYSMSVDKQCAATGPVKLGDEITYTVTVSNNGNMVLNDVTVRDTLWGADKVTSVTVSGVEDAQDVSDGSYTIASLTPGSSVTITYTYTVTQADVKAETISNGVTAQDDNNTKEDTTETPVNPQYTITINYVDGEGKALKEAETITMDSGEHYSYNVSYADGALIPYDLPNYYVFSHFTDESVLSGTLKGNVTITAVYTTGTVSITPADITLYQGGDGYVGIVNNSGTPGTAEDQNNNGLPEPGYYIQLGTDLNNALRSALGVGSNEIVDLSQYVEFVYSDDEQNRTWTIEKYDEDGNSKVSDGRYIYRIVSAEGQVPVRLVITDEDNEIVLDDEFSTDLLNGGDIYQEYTTSIYPGLLQQDQIKLVIKNTGSSLDGNMYTLDVNPGKMTVRGTTESSGTALIGQEGAADSAAAGFSASVANGTTYTVNDSQIGLNDTQGVALLVDDLISEGVAGENQQLITDVIEAKTAQAIQEENADFEVTETTNFEMRYMNLVDTNNGNVYVTAKDQNGNNANVTISWPMPENADNDGKFYIVHFDGMDREYDNATELAIDINEWENINVVEGNVNGDSISFTTDSFSPFILVYETDNGGSDTPDNPGWTPDGGDDGPDGLNTEDHFSYIVGYAEDYRTGEPTDNEDLWPVKPNNQITRAEVATIFYRLLEDEVRDEYDTTVNDFSDVSADSWYNQTVSTLASMEIVKGYEDGTFRPNAPITRAEFGAIATRFFAETGATYEPGTFSDVTGDEWYANAIQDAVNLGLIGGYEDGTVRPNNNITRAEACAIVNRTLGRVPDADHLLPDDVMKTWPDNPESAWFYADMQEATNGHEYSWITEDGNEVEEWTDLLDKDWTDR